MKFILGTKTGMTQVFDADGTCHPATVVTVEPMTITQLKQAADDGYEAVQVATGSQKDHRLTKAERGHFKAGYQHVKEFRPRTNYEESVETFTVGQTLDASVFAPGDKVVVAATSKGKGFQGVVKRHGFKGGPASHGQKHSLREPGSIGQTGINRVLKGMRMAGRMGGDRITVKNLLVLQVNPEAHTMLIKGAIPGRNGSLVEVRNV